MPKGKEATAEAVCAALLDSRPLFHFDSSPVHRIGLARTEA
jgi:hypothetical protein